jgi:hypothetical protein
MKIVTAELKSMDLALIKRITATLPGLYGKQQEWSQT